jgi:hypothetical protein
MNAAEITREDSEVFIMVTIEQIDEFRKRTNSSYADAKYFLEKNQGDILEAIIDFERTKTGKTQNSQQKKGGDDFGKNFAEMLQKGFDTRIFIEDKNSTLFTIPVILLVFLIPFWPFALLFLAFLYILGYKFSVKCAKNENVNINSFFHNINDKMKEGGMNKGYQGCCKQKSTDSAPPATVQTTDLQPVPPEDGKPDAAEKDKDDGYKEYTVE